MERPGFFGVQAAVLLITCSCFAVGTASQENSFTVSATPYVRVSYKIERGFFEAHWYVAFLLLLVSFAIVVLGVWFIIYIHFAEPGQLKHLIVMRRPRGGFRTSSERSMPLDYVN
ncbi:hypothetical protein TcYC6_0103900 [Trypanosoma cruzi]|nr:hypothetical protein TcYC6_0103900 [Trypanosoma cruzi]RNC59281.1 hypothetical protein TcCL_ESM03086 [Trypanosoma cruzi]